MNDDIFMMWEHGEEELQKFLEALDCYHPTIKFTAEYFRAQINFLDATIKKTCYWFICKIDWHALISSC